MNEPAINALENHTVETGDVFAMKFSAIPFTLLVTSPDDRVDDPVYGSRMSICWLQHPDPSKEGNVEWLWESTLRDVNLWEKLASAR